MDSVFITNFESLAISPERKLVLDMVEAGLAAIQFKPAVETQVKMDGQQLSIAGHQYNLSGVKNVYVVGFGKGSAEVCLLLEGILGDRLKAGWDIDVVESPAFQKVAYTKGTHPVPSQANLDFTKNVLDQLTNLNEDDLVLVVICGGGSALFEYPRQLSLEQIAGVNEALVTSGATITEMNIVRKHVSAVKGGKLAEHLYPAQVACLIFSDVPGNDLATIASGPTVKNNSTLTDAHQVLEKYQLSEKLADAAAALSETPDDPKFFANIDNILLVSNQSALTAMQKVAEQHGLKVRIYSDKLQGDAHALGAELINATEPGSVLLAGGESTIKITHPGGKGGRNQALALASLSSLADGTIIAPFDSDGWDFYGLAGAIADQHTLQKAQQQGLNPQEFLDQDNSFAFWRAVGDGIETGKLESNVADLIIVYRP